MVADGGVDMTQRQQVKDRASQVAKPADRAAISGLARGQSTVPSAVMESGGPTSVVVAAPAPGWPSTTGKESGKKAKPEAPKFLLLLYEILEVEDARVIRWSEDGSALQILSPETVTEKILPKYFNHTNFHSFQRQLNYFGFRKWTKSKTDICTFSHPYFRQNQPELLQLIKRKKAPRRTANPEQPHASARALVEVKRLAQVSVTGKRKLSGDDKGESAPEVSMPLQTNTSNVLIHPGVNGGVVASMTTPHTSTRQAFDFSQDSIMQYLPGPSPLLNNVISPLAASGCKKKAKKMDRKEYMAPERLTLSSMNGSAGGAPDLFHTGILPTSTDQLPQGQGVNSGALPTLDIVRNRIIRRQHVGGIDPNENGQSSSSSAMTPPQQLPEYSVPSPATASMSVDDQNPAPPNSFSDPVNILLRIKKSRTLSEGQHQGSTTAAAGDQTLEQSDNMASLHNFLLGHSLYTNRLEAQLKYVAEENDALKQLLDMKHREIEALQNDRKVLQHENAVLAEDKSKLFEINRDLMGKLFPH